MRYMELLDGKNTVEAEKNVLVEKKMKEFLTLLEEMGIPYEGEVVSKREPLNESEEDDLKALMKELNIDPDNNGFRSKGRDLLEILQIWKERKPLIHKMLVG